VPSWILILLAVALLVVVPAGAIWRITRREQGFGALTEDTTYATLHTAAQAAQALRAGLTPETAQQASRPLRLLLGDVSVAITSTESLLAWEGPGDHHGAMAAGHARNVLLTGRTEVLNPQRIQCGHPYCAIHVAVIAPLVVDSQVVGTLAAYGSDVGPSFAPATTAVAEWMSSQLELAELAQLRQRLANAEVKALRAQISPHFIFNALTAIASYVRTDPDNARELLLDFADFTRYSLQEHGQFTTMAEELRSINRYLALERARFGERLQVTVRVAPEVLAVVVPFLCLQPIVENAVQHGVERKPGIGRVTIIAEDAGSECVVRIEDDGAGADPEHIRGILAGTVSTDSLGIANVDERLRTVFGDEYGLVIETAPQAGTAVTLRFPKYHPGVRV
jgi:two-component system LytT family sensor kinase